MSFFGFNSSLPKEHNLAAPGFGQAPDQFAALGQRPPADDGDAYVLYRQ
jgi:Topoisomerase II-associated protein PAT1